MIKQMDIDTLMILDFKSDKISTIKMTEVPFMYFNSDYNTFLPDVFEHYPSEIFNIFYDNETCKMLITFNNGEQIDLEAWSIADV